MLIKTPTTVITPKPSTIIEPTKVPSTETMIRYRLPARIFLSVFIKSFLQTMIFMRRASQLKPCYCYLSVLWGLYHDSESHALPLKISVYACIIVQERAYCLTELHESQ